MRRKLAPLLGSLFGIAILVVAVYVLKEKLSHYSAKEFIEGLKVIAWWKILFGVLLTVVYNFSLTGYDWLAFRAIRHPLAYSKIALASFVGYAFSHNIGLTVLSGGSVRFRIHTSFGLSPSEIAKVIGFCTLTFWLGFWAVSSFIFLLNPIVIPPSLNIPLFHTVAPFGGINLALLVTYCVLATHISSSTKIMGVRVSPTTGKTIALQILISALDWLLAAFIMYILLPHAAEQLTFENFLGLYVLAQIAGIGSQIPGGLGVFETVLLLLLPGGHEVQTLAAMVVFRVIFYLVPFVIALILLATHEVKLGRKKFLGILPTPLPPSER